MDEGSQTNNTWYLQTRPCKPDNTRTHSGGYEQRYLLEYNAVQSVESQPTFRRNILIPSSGPNKLTRYHRGKLHVTCFHAGIFLGLFDPEDGGICSPETSIDFQQTTRRYIPEASALQDYARNGNFSSQ
jgi:hypothetical protein